MRGFKLSRQRFVRLGLALVMLLTGALWFDNGGQAARTAAAASETIGRQADTIIYVVRRGDTLASIARRFNTTVAVLMRLNRIQNPNRILIGQRLRVPAPADGSEAYPVRINFPAGGTAATVTGTVTSPNRFCYVAGARAGQEMTVQVTSPAQAANFLVKAVNPSVNDGVPLKRLENEDRSWTGLLPATGDYLICVATASGSVTYSLTLTLPPLTATPAPTPAPIRVQFPPGGTAVTLTGVATFPQQVCYVLGAQAGQEMTVSITSPGSAANFLVSAVDIAVIGGFPLKRLENEARTWSGPLPATTDYLICAATAAGSVSYSLTIAIPPLSSPPAPTRIQFPPGGTSATLTGTASSLHYSCYVLRALAHQRMTIQVTSPGSAASFSLVGADGSPLKRIEVGGPSYSDRLPLTQDYTICVGVPAGTSTVNYTLFVAVDN